MAPRNYTSPVRARHAEDTRQAILAAALQVFSEKGYAAASMASIAKVAAVALNTVYTSVGGKPELILALTQEGTDDEEIEKALARMLEVSPDAERILAVVAEGTAVVTRRQLTLLVLVMDNRTADPALATAADLAEKLYRERLRRVADHLIDLDALRPGLTRARAEQILWYHFGVESWRTVRKLGWSWKYAADWLAGQAANALLVTPSER